jgi:hypothetical protein
MQQDAGKKNIITSVIHQLFLSSNFPHPELPLSLYQASVLSFISLVAYSHFSTFVNAKAFHGTPLSATMRLLLSLSASKNYLNAPSRVLLHPPVIHFPTDFSTNNHLCILSELPVTGPSIPLLFLHANSCKAV